MSNQSISIADKQTLDEIKSIVEDFKFMNIISCSFNGDDSYVGYDPIELPTLGWRNSFVVYQNELHMFWNSKHYKFDGSSWSEVGDTPENFYYGSAVVLNGAIHMLGGQYATADQTKHYKWDGTEWTSVSTLPYAFAGQSVFVFSGKIYILGNSLTNDRDKHYELRVSSGTYTWASGLVATLPTDANTFSGITVTDSNGYVHILNNIDGKYYTIKGDNKTTYQGKLPITGNAVVAGVVNDRLAICSQTDAVMLKDGVGKKITIGLPAGTKLFNECDIDKVTTTRNCQKQGPYIEVTNDGVIEFLVDTTAETTKLTMLY